LPLAYLPLLLLAMGLGWFLASLGMYVRDVSQAVMPWVQMMMFMAPIFFPITAIPAVARWVFFLNPLTIIIYGFRETAIWQVALRWPAWGACTIFAAAIAWFGLIWFEKTKRGFADLL